MRRFSHVYWIHINSILPVIEFIIHPVIEFIISKFWNILWIQEIRNIQIFIIHSESNIKFTFNLLYCINYSIIRNEMAPILDTVPLSRQLVAKNCNLLLDFEKNYMRNKKKKFNSGWVRAFKKILTFKVIELCTEKFNYKWILFSKVLINFLLDSCSKITVDQLNVIKKKPENLKTLKMCNFNVYFKVVCVKEVRPEIPGRWNSNITLRTLYKVRHFFSFLNF